MVSREERSASISSNYTNNSSNNSNEEYQEDTVSVATSASTQTEGEEEEEEEIDAGRNNKELMLTDIINREDDRPSFGNVAVSNSTDVHFGNKTYYQGPVTIKQFLYTNPRITNGDSETQNEKLSITNDGGDGSFTSSPPQIVPDNLGKDNPNFIPDDVNVKPEQNDNKTILNGGGCAETQRTDLINNKGGQWLQNFSRQHIFLVVSLVAVLVVSLVTLMAVLLTRHHSTESNNFGGPSVYPTDTPEQDNIAPPTLDTNFTLPPKLKIISRIAWVAQPAVEALTALHTPVPFVIIMHTATEFCEEHPKCVLHVRYIQQFHIESRGWWDIGYNFLIGGDGFAYEGRGWTAEGAHTYGYNSKSIGIAFIGTFNNTMPPQRAIIAAKQLIEKGVELKFISKDYKLFAARQLQSTQSPGQLLFEDIKTWPHWTEKP